jgi:hypothetical protein
LSPFIVAEKPALDTFVFGRYVMEVEVTTDEAGPQVQKK